MITKPTGPPPSKEDKNMITYKRGKKRENLIQTIADYIEANDVHYYGKTYNEIAETLIDYLSERGYKIVDKLNKEIST